MPYIRKRDPLPPCPVELVFSQVAGKWKVRILDRLSTSSQRFVDLRRALPPVSQQVLASQLKELREDELVCCQTEIQNGQRASLYQLTELGRSLVAALDSVAAYGTAQLAARQLTGKSAQS